MENEARYCRDLEGNNEQRAAVKSEVEMAEKTVEDVIAHIEERINNLKSEYTPTNTPKKVGVIELRQLKDILKKARIDELQGLIDWIEKEMEVC
jgi:ribosome-binding ATPase YchF (GTP1/OBG family)